MKYFPRKENEKLEKKYGKRERKMQKLRGKLVKKWEFFREK